MRGKGAPADRDPLTRIPRCYAAVGESNSSPRTMSP